MEGPGSGEAGHSMDMLMLLKWAELCVFKLQHLKNSVLGDNEIGGCK